MIIADVTHSRRTGRRRDSWRYGEPSIAEVMEDPLVHQVMKRDGLTPDDVWSVVRDARARLGGRLCRVTRLAA